MHHRFDSAGIRTFDLLLLPILTYYLFLPVIVEKGDETAWSLKGTDLYNART